MTFYNLIFTLLFFVPLVVLPQNNLGDSKENALIKSLQHSQGTNPNNDERNENIQNHQADQNIEATTFEIKAVLTKCSKPNPCDCESTFECALNQTDAANLRTKENRNKCEEEADEEVLQNCEKKISLTLKIKNKGITNCKPQYIILDHVFDSITERKQKLLNPYVLKVIQRPVFQTYELLFENVVNSDASENVKSKNDVGYTGCSTDPANPTCGAVKYDNKEVPYSTGFCCSCDQNRGNDAKTNIDFLNTSNNLPAGTVDPKEISNLDLPNINDPVINSEIGLKDSTETNMPNLPDYNKNDYGLTDRGGKLKEEEVPMNVQNMIPDNIGYAPRIDRQLMPKVGKSLKPKKRIHKRGGQDCDDKYTPANADSNSYHESTHCLEFSDVWYSIYRIAHPDIAHSLQIKIFEKIGMKGGKIHWREVTGGQPICLGTASQRYTSKDGNILAYYTVSKKIDSEFALECKTHRLLVPETSGKEVDKNQHPELAGGPGEYLVVKEDEIDLSGKTCDKAGVGYEAFARQPRRCDVQKNSCLQNQPKQMWERDHVAESNGKRGCHFLKNYGCLPENPIRTKHCNGSEKQSQNKVLYMYYTSYLTSIVNINFAADLNVILRPDSLAIITEVYTETLNPKKTTIIAKVLNSGLVTSIFYVGIGGCPMDLPASFGSIASQPVMIAPQHQHIFTLEIYCELPIKNFYCSLEVLNLKQELIAIRRIRFERMDRCICVWYCQCTCLNSDYYGLKCNPLEIQQFHAAGFQGGMPVATQVVNYSAFDDTVSVILHIMLYFCITLWYMGLIKAMLGCCILPIGLWGLDKILDLPKKLNRYYEPELKEQEVVYDEDGWAIHPETGKKVNNVAPPTQFAFNMVFFLIFPFVIIWNVVKRLLAPKYSPSEMFSDLDVCKCQASQITLIRSGSSPNKSQSKSKSGGNTDKKKKGKRCSLFRSKKKET